MKEYKVSEPKSLIHLEHGDLAVISLALGSAQRASYPWSLSLPVGLNRSPSHVQLCQSGSAPSAPGWELGEARAVMPNSTRHHSQALVSLSCFWTVAERLSTMGCWFDRAEKQTNPRMNAGLGRKFAQCVARFKWKSFVVPHFLTTGISMFRKSVPSTMFYHKLKQLKHKSHLESVNFQISIIRPQKALSSVYALIYQKTII